MPINTKAAAKPVLKTQQGAVCIITLNRPESLNAMNEGLLVALKEAMYSANADPSVNVILLRGAGRAFCTGKDLKEHKELGLNKEAAKKAIELLHDSIREILFGEKIVLAGVNNWAVGGGLELMIACDLVILNQSARMFFPEMPLGLFVTGGVTSLLPRMIGSSRATALMLSGEHLDAQTALEIGLVWKVIADDEFGQKLMLYAQKISEMPQESQRDLKKVMVTGLRTEIEQAFELEAKAAERGAADKHAMERIITNRSIKN